MISNEGLYTNLTWSQVLLGLVVGLAVVFVINAMERRRRNRQSKRGGVQPPAAPRNSEPEVRSIRRGDDLPSIVVSIMRAAYYTLGALASSRKPVFLGAIVRRVHEAQKARGDRDLLTPVAIRAALDRLVSHGNVRLGRRGISITECGRELFTRVSGIDESPVPEHGQSRDALRSGKSLRTRLVAG